MRGGEGGKGGRLVVSESTQLRPDLKPQRDETESIVYMYVYMHRHMHVYLQLCTSLHSLGGVGMNAGVCSGSCGPAFSASVQDGKLTSSNVSLLALLGQ